MKTIVTADRTCDLNDELLDKHGIETVPYHIILGKEQYKDNIDISPSEVFARFERDGLPKTAAVSVAEYVEFFRNVIEKAGEPCEIVHITLGSALTSSYQNCVLASQEVSGVYPVDSCTLSSATGLMVMDASDMAKSEKSASEIQEYLQSHVTNYHASFVIDTLKYLEAGGRCSSLAALASAALNIKPGIVVDGNDHGSMKVARKYRGRLDKVLVKYVHDELSRYDNIDYRDCMITSPESLPDIDEYGIIRDALKSEAHFENVYETKASCTIGSHCGPGTIGILFRTL